MDPVSVLFLLLFLWNFWKAGLFSLISSSSSPHRILTCRKRKSSACFSLCSFSSSSRGSKGSCFMTSPLRGPVSCADIDDDDEEEGESSWCSWSSSSVSSGWLWCCLAGPDGLEFTVEAGSPGLDMIWGTKEDWFKYFYMALLWMGIKFQMIVVSLFCKRFQWDYNLSLTKYND